MFTDVADRQREQNAVADVDVVLTSLLHLHGRNLSAPLGFRPPQGEMVNVHNREPLYLSSQLYSDWLDPHSKGSQELIDEVMDSSASVAADLAFRPIGPGWLSSHPASRQGNASLLDEVTPS
ncbi:SOS response-associated peptidase [Nesterenkonia ebinurensis]|uniref:SOS response-associated peptidase n=1 Tax=Nesterenkonia ebinurensis TaxID=2608252 RepID=UPI00123DBD88|nr:SOS response-associated peptidase [Nesterenkonia ebinurensis]